MIGMVVITAFCAAGTYLLAWSKLDPVVAGQKLNTTEMPWAPFHYSTEFILAPTRYVFQPEAGVDIAPLIWLMMSSLASELLCGPAGILQLASSNAVRG